MSEHWTSQWHLAELESESEHRVCFVSSTELLDDLMKPIRGIEEQQDGLAKLFFESCCSSLKVVSKTVLPNAWD